MFESLYDKLTYYYNKEVTNDNSMVNWFYSYTLSK
jgi:hypothetical protein